MPLCLSVAILGSREQSGAGARSSGLRSISFQFPASCVQAAIMAYAVCDLDDIPMPAAAVEPEASVLCPVTDRWTADSLQVVDGDQVAMDRWRRLTQQECGIGRSAGTLWIGSCQEAVQWAGQHVAYVVNAADVDFKWHPWCLRFWANINFKGVLNHVTHEHRMGVVVWLILTAMMMGEDVLVHCRQGKHRSAVVCLLIMLIIGSAQTEELVSLRWATELICWSRI